VPLVVYALCRWLLPKRYGHRAGAIGSCAVIGLFAYGLTFGFEEFKVTHIEYASPEVPEAFNGYRIVQFSDSHVGSYAGRRQWVVQRAVDSIQAQFPDMVVFTGDLQNVNPSELEPFRSMLRSLHAPDGVFSVLGNHDYDRYQSADESTKRANCLAIQQFERSIGWQLLMNEHRVIRRDSDSLVVAGMENWSKAERMPRKGDVAQTLNSPSSIIHHPSDFVLMLQHDPTCWREKILPECNAQLTLSGHTHGGQFQIFGWSPVAFSYDEWQGMHYEGSRALYVSTGAGSLIPFRLNQPREIAVITLRAKALNDN
jgi:predicted MPP superfamily phosphohydrolase